MEKRRICAECNHWDMGDFWGTGSGKHGVLVESKGWCLFKKNKRKRWNYCPACKDFDKRKMNGFIYEGGGKPIEEDLKNIAELMEDTFGNN